MSDELEKTIEQGTASSDEIKFAPNPRLNPTENKAQVAPEVQWVIDKYNDLKDEVRESKKEFLLIFGIFASFVTFLSVEIQIFKTVTSFWLLLGLSSFLLSAILLFTLVINNIVKDKDKSEDFRGPVFIILYMLLVVSVCFFFMYFKFDYHASNYSPDIFYQIRS